LAGQSIGAVSNRRLSALIAPREHGAWGLLLVPLFTGGALGLLNGGEAQPLGPLTLAVLSLFWLRTPVETWTGAGLIRIQTDEERRGVAAAIVGLATVAALALLSLFIAGRNRELLPLGLAAVAAFLAQNFLRKLGRSTRMLAQFVGSLGLTVTAPAAYYVVTGQLDRNAFVLWAANFFFAVNQVHYVQMRIHAARLTNRAQKFAHGYRFLIAEAVMITGLVAGWRCHLLPALAVLAFLPIAIRGAGWFVQKQNSLLVRKLGWTELIHSVAFGILLVAAVHFGS
jgi:YwiC-like protein